MVMVRREMTLVPAAAPAVPAATAPAADPAAPAAPASRVRTFVASSEAVDSYNTTIKSDGWVLERFDRNPVVPLFHNYRQFPVGKGRAYVDAARKQLMVDIDFAPATDPVSGPLAEQTLLWVDSGVLGVSVGFNPLEYVYNEERETGDSIQDFWNPPLDYTRQELLEISVAVIPANADALAEGRALVQRCAPHLEQRLLGRQPPPALPPPAVEVPGVTAADIRELLHTISRDVVREEMRAVRARRTGTLG